jgi:hypothetical protein
VNNPALPVWHRAEIALPTMTDALVVATCQAIANIGLRNPLTHISQKAHDLVIVIQ